MQVVVDGSPLSIEDVVAVAHGRASVVAGDDLVARMEPARALVEGAVERDETVKRIHADLKSVNEELWVIEDDIRDKERAKEFDERFIELARAVYYTNDRRAAAKKELNVYLRSTIVEEKSYQDYE